MGKPTVFFLMAVGVAFAAAVVTFMGSAFFTSRWPVLAFGILGGAAAYSAHRRSRRQAQTLTDASLGHSVLSQHHTSVSSESTGADDGD